jgi:hypothetical protein
MLVYNAHRFYGALRWPLVLTNWLPRSYDCVGADACVVVATVNPRAYAS